MIPSAGVLQPPCLVAVNNTAAPLQSPQPAGVVVNIILEFLPLELYLFTGLVMETPVIGRWNHLTKLKRIVCIFRHNL